MNDGLRFRGKEKEVRSCSSPWRERTLVPGPGVRDACRSTAAFRQAKSLKSTVRRINTGQFVSKVFYCAKMNSPNQIRMNTSLMCL